MPPRDPSPAASTEAASTEPASPGKRPGPFRRFLQWYWGKRDSADKAEPISRTLIALALLAIGVAGSEAYGYIKGRLVGPDEYLVKISDQQEQAFKDIQSKLDALGGSLDRSGRQALGQVEGALKEIQGANRGLLEQLALAKQENERLSQVAGRQSGVSGGYDFILSQNTGMALDASTQVGVGRITGTRAYVRLSANGQENTRQVALGSGQSVAYQNAAGKSCRLALLSIGGGGQSASFAVSCS